MIKLIKAEWIADKSLDMYCSLHMEEEQCNNRPIYRTLEIKSKIGKIFDDVLKTVEDTYLSYDKIIVTVPCFPIMRMKDSPSIITRFICKHPKFLKEHGISAVQFLDYFEKFIQKNCDTDGLSKSGNIYFLKSKYILEKEWIDEVIKQNGRLLVNDDKDYIFINNPDFVISLESDRTLFSKITREQQYKLETVVNEI